jgi:hypothetical protein
MKTPIKNQNDEFVCEECNAHYDRFCELSRHIGLKHNKQDYYNKYLKEEKEDICPICGNKNSYLNRWDRGYKKTCSYKCANILRKQLEETTKLKKYGNKKYNNSTQRNKTMIKKYGNKCPMQNPNIHKKIKENNIKKIGVEYPFQSDKIQQKVINKFSQYRKFKDTTIYYNTSYELDFLENYFHVFPDIQRGKSIKYTYKRKLTYYLPDFYIPSLNLIVEIKNSYLAKRDKNKIIAKKKATISNGFNYIMITNKRYNKFNKLFYFYSSQFIR